MARDDVHAPAGPTKKGTRRRDGVPRPCGLSLSTSVSSWDTLARSLQPVHAVFQAVALVVTGGNPRAIPPRAGAVACGAGGRRGAQDTSMASTQISLPAPVSAVVYCQQT